MLTPAGLETQIAFRRVDVQVVVMMDFQMR
jgi:hypothetical protein